jgi:hypothetical protein
MEEKALHEVAVDEIRKILNQKQFKNLRLVEQPAKTGLSFFQGKSRLCKVLKTKRGLTIELNVNLPKAEFNDTPGLESISPALAHKKHLGTMRHVYRGTDMKEVKRIMAAAIKIFQENMEAIKEELK